MQRRQGLAVRRAQPRRRKPRAFFATTWHCHDLMDLEIAFTRDGNL
jgi:hypothetical protein